MTFPPATVPLFVYGSLRPGMALWSAIASFVDGSRPARIAGRLHWHEGGEWPLLLPGGTDQVRGDLLFLRPGDEVNRVIVDEELLYGYDARWMPVATDDGEQIAALVMVWPRGTELGPAIPGGDFAAAVAARGEG